MAYDGVAVVALWMAATALAMAVGFPELNAARDPFFALYLCAVWFAYLAWCWHRGGMTLGMRAWRIHITTADGQLPGWGRCLARFLAALLSAAPLGLGFLYALIDRDRRCWHDLLTGTRLLRDPS